MGREKGLEGRGLEDKRICSLQGGAGFPQTGALFLLRQEEGLWQMDSTRAVLWTQVAPALQQSWWEAGIEGENFIRVGIFT